MYRPEVTGTSSKAIVYAAVAVAMSGCAATSTIQPVGNSRSGFDGAVYAGSTAVVAAPTPGREAYRLFHQGATGFVTVAVVREDAELRAKEFCDRQSRVVRLLSETTSTPPHVLGNFPRVELVFECADRPAVQQPQRAAEDRKFTRLVNLKKLLDAGVLTREEFEREKAKVLAEP